MGGSWVSFRVLVSRSFRLASLAYMGKLNIGNFITIMFVAAVLSTTSLASSISVTFLLMSSFKNSESY